jgi:signal transduction histidine kinase
MEKVRINELIVDVANGFVNTIVNASGAGAARLNVDWNQDSSSKNDNHDIENSNAIAYNDAIAKSKEGEETEVGVSHSSDSHQISKNISKLSREGRRRKENQEIVETENQEDLGSMEVTGGAQLEQEQDQGQEQKRLLEDSERQQQEQQPQQRLTIDVDLDPKIKEITVDKDRISQVLSNLIDNSIKFTTNMGCCIKIQTRLVSQSVSESLKVDNDIHNNDIDNNSNSKIDDDKYNYNFRVNIIISDTGGGIADDLIPRLFEKFATKGIKGKGNGQGTGLGLFITKSIITAHNGAIRAFNNDIGGTTFSIVLPAK